MASIADLFAKLLLDDSGFEASVVKSATKAGDAAGQTMGQRMSATLKTTLGVGAKVAATALAGGLAIAARGAAELENITADFQAATGASADEAVAAGKTINRVAGDERQSLQSVSAAAIKVRTDLGATGPEADKLTAAFVRFARVTKQDAAGSVADFDDILDAWGLTASDSVGIMDKLLVSQQRFGGSITESQKALAALAPSLKAANLNIDDGIGLLNLFQASGVDAAVAVTGMTKALTKVKSPAELKALVADIIATEDPFLRAQKASDLFGAKAGAKLANALKPGAKALGEYQISVEDAAGATDKAADIIDNTFTGRIQKAISQATAGLREFGAGFGPALTGLASLSTLAGAAGGGKLVKGILGPIGGLGKALAVKLAAAIGIGFASSAVTGAAEAGGDLIGFTSTKALQKRLAGKAVSDVMAKGLSDGLIGVESSSLVKSSSDRLGKFMGSSLGKVLSVAFAAVAVVEVVKTYNDVADAIKQETGDLAKQTGDFAETATLDALLNARKGVAEQLKAMGHDPIAEALGLSARKGVEETLAQLDAAIARHRPADKLIDDFVKPIAAIPGEIAKVDVGPAVEKLVATIEHITSGGAGDIANAAALMLAGIPVRVREASFAAALAAAKTPGEIADAIQSRRNLVDAAMDNLTSVIKNNKGSERAKVLGYLIGDELAKALKSKDPLIRATADETQRLLLERLDELVPASGEIGKAGMDQLNKAIHSKNPVVAEHAREIKQTILDNIKANTKPIGEDMAEGIAKGLSAKDQVAAKAARKLAHDAMLALKKGWGNPVLEANLKIAGLTTHQLGLNAEGGPVKKGAISWVGEEGPELMEFGGDAFITPADVSKRAVDAAAVPGHTGRPERPSAGAAVANGVKAAAAAFVAVVVPPLRDVIVQLGKPAKAAPTPPTPPTPPVAVNVTVEPAKSPAVDARPPAPDAPAPRRLAAAMAQQVKLMPETDGTIVPSVPPGRPGGPAVASSPAASTPLAAKLVEVVTRSIANVAREVTSSVSDTTVVLRELVEKVSAQPTAPTAAAPMATGVKWELRPQSFARGGIVAGPPGQQVPIIAHGGEEVVTAETRRQPETISTAVVHALTRSVSDIARRVSDSTIILREIVEKVVSERAPAGHPDVAAKALAPALGPAVAAQKTGAPPPASPPGRQVAAALTPRTATGPVAEDRRNPEPVSAAIVKTITRTLSEVAHRVSDTTVVLRRIVENVERPIVQAGPTITARKPGVPKPGTPTPIAAPPPKPGYPASVTPAMQPVAPRAVAQAVQTRVKQMREAMPGPWMPAAAIADVGGSLRPPTPHVPSFRAPSIAPARVPSGLAAVPDAGGGSVREGDIHVNLLDKLEVRSVRDIGGGLRMLGEQGYLGPKGPGRRKG